MIPLLPVSPVHPSESGIYFTCGAFIICNYAKFSLFFRQFHKNMQAYRKHFFPKVVSCFLIFRTPEKNTYKSPACFYSSPPQYFEGPHLQEASLQSCSQDG